MSRIPLIVAVVGALLVGGAITGTTRASWTDNATQASSKVMSGTMAMSASVSTASVSVPRGESRSLSLTLKDESSLQAANLQQKLSATTSSSSPANISASISASGGSCSGVALPQTVQPGQQRTSCVTLTAPAGATPGQYTVTVVPSGTQSPSAGWTSIVSSIPISVTVTAPVVAPAAPVITCNGTSQNGFSWAAVTGAVDYSIFSSNSQTSAYTQVGGDQTARTHTPNVTGQSTTYWRVKANNAGGPSVFSNTLRITRSGSNYTCSAVTP